jgi:Spy/CpxP family protein refolding chaperone
MKKVICFTLLSVAAAFAQPPRGMFPWWESGLVRDLNLSEEQQKQIQSTVREYRDRMIDLRAAVQKAEAQVQDLMNEDKPDVRRSNEAIDKLVNARSELTRVFSQMGFRIRGVLTQEQWRELQRRRPHEGMRPGARGGPGMRPMPRRDRMDRPGTPPPPAAPPKPDGNAGPDAELD